jgi:hypothetical protein
VDVDESGSDDEARRVEPSPSRGISERTATRDARDLVATNCDVTIEPGRASSIDDAAVLDYDVIRRVRG